MAINVTWHRSHPLPPNPTIDERIEWHLDHAKQCGCRPFPPRLIAAMTRLRHPAVNDHATLSRVRRWRRGRTAVNS
jgi:hypothetical protein